MADSGARTMPPTWVELRIHGVSGTLPEDLLSDPHVIQVAGNSERRIYQRCGHDGAPLGIDDDGRLLEGYHWGSLTSGSWRQALWLFLIPFGLINAAQFMLPSAPRLILQTDSAAAATNFGWWRTRLHVLSVWTSELPGSLVRLVALLAHLSCGGVLRFIGLAQTCVLAFSSALIFMEMAGRQWAARLADSDGPDVSSGVTLAPGVALTIGLALSVATVLVLFWVGGTLQTQDGLPDEDQQAYLSNRSGLAVREFLAGDPSASDLRRLHLAGGWLVIGVLAANVRQLTDLIWLAHVALAAVAVTVVLMGDLEGSASVTVTGGRRRFAGEWRRMTARGVSWAGLVVSAIVIVASAVDILAINEVSETPIPRLQDWANGLITANVAAVLLLLAMNLVLAVTRRERTPAGSIRKRFGRYAGGNATALVTAVAVYTGLGFSAAFTYAAARLFGLKIEDQLPALVQRTAFAWGVTMVLVVLVGAVALIDRSWRTGNRRRGRPGVLVRRAAVDFAQRRTPGLPDPIELPGSWLPRVAQAMWTARLKNRLSALFILFTTTGTLMSVVAGYEEFHTDPLPEPIGDFFVHRELPSLLGAFSSSSEATDGWMIWMMWIGTSTLILLALWLVALGRGAVFKKNQRRTTSILWDVISFWPLSAHPFAPLPYSQVAVLQLRDRIRWHLRQPAVEGEPAGETVFRRVVVSAHSQGSLIAVTAMLWLTREERRHVGLVTHGSQLQVAFARGFPAYVNVWLLGTLASDDGELGGRWINLYRETDPIAGPVLSWSHWGKELPTTPAEALASFSFVLPPATDGTEQDDDRHPDQIMPTGRRVCGRDWRLLDPSPADLHLQTGAVARIHGHGNYYADPDWPAAVRAVLPDPVTAEPPLPAT